MSSKGKSELNDKLVETALTESCDSFNFELWVKGVRPQLIAVLQRRANILKD
jgi:hypothetical protein